MLRSKRRLEPIGEFDNSKFPWSAPSQDRSPADYRSRPDLHERQLFAGGIKRTFDEYENDRKLHHLINGTPPEPKHTHPTGEDWSPPSNLDDSDIRMTDAPPIARVQFTPPHDWPFRQRLRGQRDRRSSPPPVQPLKSILKQRMQAYEQLPEDYHVHEPFEYDTSAYIEEREAYEASRLAQGSRAQEQDWSLPSRKSTSEFTKLLPGSLGLQRSSVSAPRNISSPKPKRTVHSPPLPAATEIYPALRAVYEPVSPQACEPFSEQGIIRRFGGMFVGGLAYWAQTFYNQTVGRLFRRVEPPKEEVFAVETDSSGRKRRAIAATDMDSNTLSPQEGDKNDPNMPGEFPAEEDSSSVAQKTPLSKEKQKARYLQPAPSSLETPPESRPSSSDRDAKQPNTKSSADLSSDDQQQAPVRLPRTRRNPTLHAKTRDEVIAIQRASLRLPEQFIPKNMQRHNIDSYPKLSQLNSRKLPNAARRPVTRAQFWAKKSQKQNEDENWDQEQGNDEREKNMEALVSRTERIMLRSKEEKELRESQRTRKERAERGEDGFPTARDFVAQAALETAEETERLRKQIDEEVAERELLEEAQRAEDEQLAVREARRAEEAARGQAERESLTARLVRPLDAEWASRVGEVMAITNQQQRVALTPDGNDLTRYDMGKILPQKDQYGRSVEAKTGKAPVGWLNDIIVDCILGMIVQRSKEQTGYVKGPNSVPEIEAYNCAWYTNYKKKRDITSIKNWSKRKGLAGTKLLRAEKIFFPVNTGAHWMLLIISPRERRIEFLDSADMQQQRYFFTLAREWLKMELGDAYDADEWEDSSVKSGRQRNLDDCGVFVCLNALASAKDKQFSEVPEDLSDLADARRMLVAVLLNGGFRHDWEL